MGAGVEKRAGRGVQGGLARQASQEMHQHSGREHRGVGLGESQPQLLLNNGMTGFG